MTELYRSLRFRELSLLRRTIKLRTVLLSAFLLMLCLTAGQMTAGGTVLDDDRSGLFFGSLMAAFLGGFLTNVEYDVDKADEASGWKHCRLALPYSGADHAAVRYQIKTGIMLVYGAGLLLYGTAFSAAFHSPFTGAIVNCYLLTLCLLEVSSILRHAAAAVLGVHKMMKRLLLLAGALLAVIWLPAALGGLLREERTLPGNAIPVIYLASHIGTLYVTLLTFAVLCGLLYLGRKITALEFDRRDI